MSTSFKFYNQIVLKIVIIACFILILAWFSVVNFDESSINNEQIYKEAPLIFIGGVPRSGSNLIKALLNTNPAVSCGQEVIISTFLYYLSDILTEYEWHRLRLAGLPREAINIATASYVYEIIKGKTSSGSRMCIKDPFVMNNITWLSEMFPAAKFVLTIRDGRAVTESSIRHNERSGTVTESAIGHNERSGAVTESAIRHNQSSDAAIETSIRRYDSLASDEVDEWVQELQAWNTYTEEMWKQCNDVGGDKCKKVFYEKLILKPEQNLHELLDFLDLTWTYNVFDQMMEIVSSPSLTGSLYGWRYKLPTNVKNKIFEIAPMLTILGYEL